jgi:ribulose-phosphate 3-epimerase
MKQTTHFKVLPSILSADFGRFVEEAATVDIPEVEYLHIDVMDGHFVPNMTFGPQVVESLKKHTRYKLDVHLMINKIPEFVPKFAGAGADIITIHQEADDHLHRHVHQIKEFGILAGVSINPATPLESIKWILSDVDLVLIMTVNPGFGGQSFIPSSLEKIEQLDRIRTQKNMNFVIEVDGGIDKNTAGKVVVSGANFLVAGNAIFGEKDRPIAIQNIINSVLMEQKKKYSRMV